MTSILLALMLALMACETTKNHCRGDFIDDNGNPYTITGMSRSTVIGGGDTDSTVAGVCGEFSRRTSGTGISPEGRLSLESIERVTTCALSKGLVCVKKPPEDKEAEAEEDEYPWTEEDRLDDIRDLLGVVPPSR